PGSEQYRGDRGGLPLTREGYVGRCILDRAVIHIPDIHAEADVPTFVLEAAQIRGWRAVLGAPMLRDGQPIGAIGVLRADPGAFSSAAIEVLKTFADQAVIAIENVRLFKELEDRNKALTEAHAQVSDALDRQTATSDILRVISQSQTDVQPVFETIADSAMRLFGAWSALVFRYDGEYLSLAAARGGLPGSREALIEQ